MQSLDAIAEQFQLADTPLRLEMLLEYAEQMPSLPDAYAPLRDAGLNMVHECQAPVFLMVELKEGTVHLVADVPREAPTARGFTAILQEAFEGATPEDVAGAPADALHRLGLDKLLGMQRLRGLTAIYQRVKNDVARQAAEAQDGAA